VELRGVTGFEESVVARRVGIFGLNVARRGISSTPSTRFPRSRSLAPRCGRFYANDDLTSICPIEKRKKENQIDKNSTPEPFSHPQITTNSPFFTKR
jgi:hypothetical protein